MYAFRSFFFLLLLFLSFLSSHNIVFSFTCVEFVDTKKGLRDQPHRSLMGRVLRSYIMSSADKVLIFGYMISTLTCLIHYCVCLRTRHQLHSRASLPLLCRQHADLISRFADLPLLHCLREAVLVSLPHGVQDDRRAQITRFLLWPWRFLF